MPFCEKCGAEIRQGKNFCSSCGSPLTAPVPTPPPSPQVAGTPLSPTPPPPATGLSRDKLIIAGVMGAAILGLIIFIGLPLLQAQDAGSTSLPGSFPSSFGAPSGTTLSPATAPPSGAAAASYGPLVYRSGEAYEQVFSRDYDVDTVQQDVFSYNLRQPPMVIEYEINPEMVTREKLVDIGKSTERYISTTYPDPAAWLNLKVTDTDTGRVATTITFSKNNVGELKQEYTIRAPGNYRFEITGNLVSPKIRLLVKQ